MSSDDDRLLSAFERANKEFKLCPNRIWAVTGEDLPDLLPSVDPIRVQDSHQTSQSHDLSHDLCTFDFCEYSQRDFTAVEQRHECKEKEKCAPLRGLFPRDLLDEAAQSDRPTVWSLDGRFLIERPRPYMAISHVWSDGTGAGKWESGVVNECLYGYFKRIAKIFQCDGIWWDTLCIPQDKVARIKALDKMQDHYEGARFTLVHDSFLRHWTWDPKTACFAILMSPWFSRAWTALELAKSRKVKVVFNGPYGPLIKDLDEEILATSDHDKPHYQASEIIRKLRAPVTSLNDLLTVLGPRYTSKAKDRAIISGHLIGVKPSLHGEEIWQQNIYRRILIQMGKMQKGIHPSHLFHNSATGSELSWFPTSLFNMPVASIGEKVLRVTESLDVVGMWRCAPAQKIPETRYTWRGIHAIIKKRLESHIMNPDKASLLFEIQQLGATSSDRALLVTKSNVDDSYNFIGAVYFNPAIREEELHDCMEQKKVTILGGILHPPDGEDKQTGNSPQV